MTEVFGDWRDVIWFTDDEFRPVKPFALFVPEAAPRSGGQFRTPCLPVPTVAHLIPAARAARAALATMGRSLSRDNLADAMRDDGHGVSNERASLLFKILKAEQDVTTIGPAPVRPRPGDMDPLSEAVA